MQMLLSMAHLEKWCAQILCALHNPHKNKRITLTKFWRKKKDIPLVKHGNLSFYEWVTGNDFFDQTVDPWDRTKKLLIEIHKRSLAEQVLLLSWATHRRKCDILWKSPSSEKLIPDLPFLISLMKKIMAEKSTLEFQDFASDAAIRNRLSQSSYETIMVSPVTLDENCVQALVLINYSELRGTVGISDFVSFVSSVLSMSLQNSRLFNELKNKDAKLKQWTLHVEKRIEEGTKQLLEKEMQFHSLFEGANDGIIVHDERGNIFEVNGVACRLLGYHRDELLKFNFQDIDVNASNIERNDFFMKVYQREKVNLFELKLKKKDGSTLVTELSSRKVRFRGIEAIQTFIRDISQRMDLESSLRESKEKYQLLVDSSLVGVFIVRNGIIEFVNRMVEDFTGHSKHLLVHRNFFDLIAPEDRSMVTRRETLREQGEVVQDRYEVQFAHKEGGKVWGEIRSCVVEIDGQPALLVNVIDITQRKQLEIKLLESQKMESIGTLAGGIAHDFNNLLGGILGYASLLLSDMTNDHPFYDDIHTIAETAKRAADLTNRLLAFARGGKYQVRDIDMNQTVKDVVAILSHTIDRSVAIETSLVKDLWKVKGDSQQIHQALLNVCLNARDAMPDGGRMIIQTSNVHLNETARTMLDAKPGDYVRVAVIDTGIGMDGKTVSRIFEPFFTTKPGGEGTGLGLSAVYGIVKNHDGTLSVESEIGQGTTMVLYFPRVYEEPQVKQEPVKSKKHIPEVLLVDDEEVIRQVGKRMLEKGGYRVHLAMNGKHAVQVFQSNQDKIDLVLLDLVMPEMGGKETFKKLREIDPDLKIVFTSGYGPYDRNDVLSTKGGVFVQKPFQTEVLLKTIHGILGNPLEQNQ